MSTSRTWNFSVEPGASNPTWSNRAISTALARINRYFNVTFPQVSRNPWMRVVMTRRHPNATWAAWTTGRTIYIPSSFRYNSFEQLVFVLVHEFGHVFGGSSHGGPNDVMAPAIRDIYRNLTQNDYRWFRSLPQRSLKAWTEPHHWRPVSQIEELLEMQNYAKDFQASVDDLMGLPAFKCGHGNWLDSIRSAIARSEVVRIDE